MAQNGIETHSCSLGLLGSGSKSKQRQIEFNSVGKQDPKCAMPGRGAEPDTASGSREAVVIATFHEKKKKNISLFF